MKAIERKQAIIDITAIHKDARLEYLESDDRLRGMAFGKMLGIEVTANYLGLPVLSKDLAELRQIAMTKKETTPVKAPEGANV